jgi:hypothetical protein
MDVSDRDWLRANRHRIAIRQPEDGRPSFYFGSDRELEDAMDDFLSEACEGLSELVFLRGWDNPTATETLEIGFEDRAMTRADLEALLARI